MESSTNTNWNIKYIMQRKLDVDEDGLIGYWPFEEGAVYCLRIKVNILTMHHYSTVHRGLNYIKPELMCRLSKFCEINTLVVCFVIIYKNKKGVYGELFQNKNIVCIGILVLCIVSCKKKSYQSKAIKPKRRMKIRLLYLLMVLLIIIVVENIPKSIGVNSTTTPAWVS